MYRNIFLLWIKKKIFIMIFSHVLRNSTPRYVRPSIGLSVRRSVGPSVKLYFFYFFAVFGPTAPAQML